MEHEVKELLNNIHPKDVVKILEPHIKWILKDENDIIILVDKTYAMNELSKTENMEKLIKWVGTTYWEWYNTVIKLNSFDDENYKREVNIPHQIHY